MKQRKPPYVLGGILLVALCAIVFIGMSFAKNAIGADDERPTKPADEDPVGKSQQAPDPKTVTQMVNAPGKGEAPRMAPGKPGMPGMPGANDPSIMTPKTGPMKPKPSDSSTPSGWYYDNSK